MNREEYILLYEKCAAGNCTDEEITLLEAYQDDFYLSDISIPETDEQRKISNRIHLKLIRSIRKQQKSRAYWYRMPLAAALAIMVIGFGLYFYRTAKTQAPDLKQFSKTNILPGSNKAILKLDDGQEIVLDRSDNGVLASEGDAVISKEDDGKLVYNTSGQAFGQKTKYNSVLIPRGGQYQLVLPDGTKIWLNAESSLRFPVAFNGDSRKVELSGEAYFEVAKNRKKPFYVLARGTEVQVLGTHFNVSAYNVAVETTLLEGSVKLNSNGNTALLKPGQSGTRDNSGAFKVEKADLETAVDWKNGFFVFHDETIQSIMQKAARWYDVEVEFKGNTANRQFYGKVSRYNNIDDLLKNLELTGEIHFKVIAGSASGQGRRIIVMP